MAGVAGEGELNIGASSQSSNFGASHVHGGDDQNDVAAHGGDVQVDRGTHQLVNVDLGIDAVLFQRDVQDGHPE